MLVALSARGFRNLQPLTWQVSPGRHLLLGDNGAGKTSLLESLYLLSSTKSFRTTQLSDCCQRGEAAFELMAEVDETHRSALSIRWSQSVRHRQLNGHQATLAEHLAAMPLVIWTSLDAESLTGEPRLRRRLLDRGLVGIRPSNLSSLSRYKRALAAKRAELLSGGRQLEVWNSVLAESAAELITLRRQYHETISRRFEEVLAESGLPFPGVTLVYRPSPPDGDSGAAGINQALARIADQERRRGEALVGPHRDEWTLQLRGTELRRIASAGERRALGMLLAIAHGRQLEANGREPVYLLDDVDAELSATTLAAVWNTLKSASQVIATSSRPKVWEELAIDRRWNVAGGALSKF